VPKQPNILVFFTDQQRWDTCGCYGQRLPVTPNLDHMATEGILFEKAFTCQPVCGPARSCIHTGKYATETGCYTNHIRLPAGETTIAHRLRAAGYETAYIGKWHLASAGPRNGPDDFRVRAVPPNRRGGYDDYWLASDVLEHTSHSYDGHMFDAAGKRREFPEGRYRVDVLGDWILEYLDSRSGEWPFFLFASFLEPHHQNDHNRYEGPHGSADRWAEYDVPGDLVDTEGDWRANYPDYLGCCNALDANLGRVLQKLDQLGIADNTLVIYASDHGSHFRTRNREYKRSCHDGCLRVPLVIRGPGFTGGRVVKELVSLIDMPSTIVSAGAGSESLSAFRGRDLRPLAAGKAPAWPEEIFAQVSEDHIGRVIRTKRWKYEVWVPGVEGSERPGSAVYHERFLYDLHEDPHERNNLITDPKLADVRADLADRLREYMRTAGEEVSEIRPFAEQQ